MMTTKHVLAALAFGLATTGAASAEMTISSPDLASGAFDEKFVLGNFGCTGENVSPAVEWSGVPEGTQSLALTVFDPDAPSGSGFWHWSVINIPADATGLAQGAGNSADALPEGAFGGQTDFRDTMLNGGNELYGGPCPPVGHGPHRYIFTLYALAVPDLPAAAGVPPTASPGVFGFLLNFGLGDGVLAKASFTATYER